jgi:hypothetical protein
MIFQWVFSVISELRLDSLVLIFYSLVERDK